MVDPNVERAGLRELQLKPEYNTDEDDIIQDFYAPCLEKATKYDRAVGYFRASIYRELGEDLLNFVIKGGKVRIVCSPDIPEPDETAAREGYELRGKRTREEQEISLIKILEKMAETPEEKDCLEMLRLLIEKKSLDLFIALRPGGIYHRKIGSFEDDYGNKVVFSGSGNETRSAIASIEDWVNDEVFDVYCNWGDQYEKNMARIKEKHLQNLFSGQSGRTQVRPLNQTEREFFEKFRLYKDLEDCRTGARKRSKKNTSILTPYQYQLEAIQNWNSANRIGILSMATGTGKTITALFAMKDILELGIPVLIVVPSVILLNQWHKEILKIYPNIPILMAGGENDWKINTNKRMYITQDKPKILLSTMDTAISDDYLDFIKQASKMAIVIDEAHRVGSQTRRKLLGINFLIRLGLSATPERIFDPIGSQAINDFFGEKPVYSLSIDAKVKLRPNDSVSVPILGHFLCQYNYLFYTIELTHGEQNKWDDLTEKIRKIYPMNKEKDEISDVLKYLLIKRSKIIKKAENKIQITATIINEKYNENDKWIIYCEDEEQLNQVINTLKKSKIKDKILKYHSKMTKEERELVLKYFEHNPGVLVSIRCLDEGVDIPSANGAIILASSKNPREYIQRRGRVLRKFKNKDYALIIDVIALPNASEEGIPLSIIKSEIARAWLFSKNSINKTVTHELWELCMKFNVNIESDAELGMEEDDE